MHPARGVRAGLAAVGAWLAVLTTGTGAALAAPAESGPTTSVRAESVRAESGRAESVRAESARDESGRPDRAQVAYLAGQLRRNPIHISDQMPRELARSAAPVLAGAAERLGGPVYVLALPVGIADVPDEKLLDAVHARLGRDGLYILLDESSVGAARPYGIGISAEEAADAAYAVSYEMPYDAGAERSFRRFVEILDSGKARQRYEAARVKYDHDSGEEPAALHTSPTDRKNQSFVTGIALAGVPVLLLVLAPYVRHWRRTLPAPSEERGNQA
ncbi:hypothetical protein [Streptomyces sp. 7N604]|uniref:hypothetical protein n=1 Tax=Streptomyces sp. 7N604 TaxID=3457415 RepID=UPI003FD3E1FD